MTFAPFQAQAAQDDSNHSQKHSSKSNQRKDTGAFAPDIVNFIPHASFKLSLTCLLTGSHYRSLHHFIELSGIMKTIFDKATRHGLIDRIILLSNNSVAQWGKMNVLQMVQHNTYWNGWVLGEGNNTYRQEFLGKVFGKMALKKMIKDEKPFDKNIPTSSQFKMKETGGDLEVEKLKWIALTKAYENYDNPAFIHDFFGKMTKEQVGILVFKHSDHHLRQFGI